MFLDFDARPFADDGEGTCAVCGCDDDHACEGGCIWANPEATLCSRCAHIEAACRAEEGES